MAIRTVPDGTEDADLFGTGIDGFTSGDAQSLVPATIVSHFVMNHFQEEVCRAAEGSGQSITTYADSNAAQTAQDGGTMDYHQLDKAIRLGQHSCSPETDASVCILSGLRLTTSGASLDVEVLPGEFVYRGRRYVITAAKIADAGFDAVTLTASMDNYLSIGPDSTDESSLDVQVTAVTVGNPEPSAPAGTFLFARCTTDGSGVTAITYMTHGPILMTENLAGLRLRRPDGAGVSAALIPHPRTNRSVDIGQEEDDEDSQTPLVGSFIRKICFQEKAMRSEIHAAAHPIAMEREYTRQVLTTSADGRIDLYDETDWDNGTAIYVTAEGVVYNATDPTDCYGFTYRFLVFKDGGSFTLNGSGSLAHEGGTGAIAASVGVTASIVSGEVGLNLLHHTSNDSLRWNVLFRVVMNGPEQP
jgi:hypothetical protein